MTTHEIDLDRVARMIRLVEMHGLTELTVEDDDALYEVNGTGVTLAGESVGCAGGGSAMTGLDGISVAEASASTTTDTVIIAAPMVGVFYRSPGPDQPPFVEIGDHVEAGQTIGLIEAMKVFSEVPADHDGVVVAVDAENGQLVQAGQPLLRLARAAERTQHDSGEEQ